MTSGQVKYYGVHIYKYMSSYVNTLIVYSPVSSNSHIHSYILLYHQIMVVIFNKSLTVRAALESLAAHTEHDGWVGAG